MNSRVDDNNILDQQLGLVDRAPAFSDEALALLFAERHEHELRYVAEWSKWMWWDEEKWQFDKTLLAFSFARTIGREAANGCNQSERIASALGSAKTAAAIEKLARADRRLAATVDQWDADPWLLNTPEGLVDLRTGMIEYAQPDQYMTKITAVPPDPSCPTSTWYRFLDRIMDGDKELIAFLQRVAGYALTGSTCEHALFFLYGTGANGKSKFLNAITGCVGDYHKTSPIETFTMSGSERHPTDLAGLRGARMVSAVETEEGRRWAENKIKTLTGGDKIAARFMRQDFFEYVPQFKLIIAGNHKPGLRNVDEAIRRRFHLIPFAVTIPPKERDRDLDNKLRAEWPGILNWAIQGCLEWQQIGLAPPKAVIEATEAYLQGQDAIGAWIDEQCQRDANAWTRSTELFADWKAWCERCGEPAGDIKRFRDRLEARSIFHKRQPGTGRTGYEGIKLQSALNGSESYYDRMVQRGEV